MGKVSPRDTEPKPSKRGKKSRGPPAKRYLKPGALAQIRLGKATSTKYCADLGKKRVGLFHDKQNKENDITVSAKVIQQSQSIGSPVNFLLSPVPGSNTSSNHSSTAKITEQTQSMVSPVRFLLSPVPETYDLSKQSNLPKTPKTPLLTADTFESDSRLESLPTDILVKILCHLHHDQLRAVFHVSQRVRKAVLIARQYYFNYTTPDRSRQEMLQTLTPHPKEHWPFVCKGDEIVFQKPSPHTPKAPRHGGRPPSRMKCTEMKQIAAVLFREPSFPSRCKVPSVIAKPSSKNRVLIYEEELCQAVAENKLR